jgi:hypothetical protein
MSVMAADGHSIAMYNKHIIKMKITNSHEECRVSEIEFIATNIKRYDAILGWPWVFQKDPDCQFHKGE